MTSVTDISRWFDAGLQRGASYMLIICDTFSYDDYPVFVHSNEECIRIHNHPGEMQKVMEVYNLRADKAGQLDEYRCFRMPDSESTTLDHDPE